MEKKETNYGIRKGISLKDQRILTSMYQEGATLEEEIEEAEESIKQSLGRNGAVPGYRVH